MFNKEYGSFFSFSLNIDYKNILANINNSKNKYFFISGRVAIKYILDNSNYKKILLPNYLCESIISNFKEYTFYNINNNFSIDIDDIKNKIISNNFDCIYIIDYFGKIDDNIREIKFLAEKYKLNIIQDFTHNLFCNNFYGDILLCSYRKTLPTPFGCLLIDNKKLLPKQLKNLSIKLLLINFFKLLVMLMKFFKIFKFIWYPLLQYFENIIDLIYIYNFDYFNYFFYILYNHNNSNIRKINFEYLNINCKYKIDNNLINTFFTYPIIFKNKEERNNIKKKLINKHIYPIIYWSLDFDKNNQCNNYISDRILCLPIDERYNINDIKYICDIINN